MSINDLTNTFSETIRKSLDSLDSSISILMKFWKSPTNPIFDDRPCYKTVTIFSENFNDQRIWIKRGVFRIDFRKQ